MFPLKISKVLPSDIMHTMQLGAILVVAAVLRLWHLNWGEPLLLHPDEMYIVQPALHLWQDQTFNPGTFNRPNHISIYINALAYQLYSLIYFKALITDTFTAHAADYHQLSRSIVAALGIASVGLAYLIGRQYAKRLGLIYALLFAVFPPYVEHAHYVTPDVPLTLYIMLVIYGAILYLKNAKNIYLIGMSVFAGIAMCEKYPGLLSLLLIAAVVLMTSKNDLIEIKNKVLLSGCTFIMTVLVCAPFLILRCTEVIKAIHSESRIIHLGADGLGYLGNLKFYALNFLSISGVMMVTLVVLGGASIVKKEKKLAMPLFFGVLYYLLLSKVPLHWERWALPMYVSCLFFAGYAMHYLCQLVYECFQQNKISAVQYQLSRGLVATVVALPCLVLLLNSAIINQLFSLSDTRYQALLFCKTHGISAQNSIYEGYTPFAQRGPGRIFTKLQDTFEQKDTTSQYVVLSSLMYNRFYAEPKRYAKEISMYARIQNDYTLVRSFSSVNTLLINTKFHWFPLLRAINFFSYLRAHLMIMPLQGPDIFIYKIVYPTVFSNKLSGDFTQKVNRHDVSVFP